MSSLITRASHREIVALSIPAMAALAADPLLSLVDTALVGRLGAVPLAAMGVSTAVFTTVFWLFNFLTYGTTAEIARLRGAGEAPSAGRHVVQALWLALLCGLLVTAVLLLAAPLILAAMGAKGEVLDQALSYLRVRALAAVPVMIVAVGHGAFRGLKDTRTPLWIAVATNLVNGFASWALIYPAGLGIAGAAWGAVGAQSGAALTFLLLGRARLRPSTLRLDPAAMRRIVTISRDLFLRTATLLGGVLVATSVAARMGVVTVAAHQIIRELWSLQGLVLDGFAIAGQALVATAAGAARPDVARADARRLTVYGLAAGVLLGLLHLSLAGVLPRLFTTDPRILAAVGEVWWVLAALLPAAGVVFVLDGILMGAADFRFLLGSTALASLGGLVPVSLLALRLDAGLVALWWAMGVLMVIRLVTTLQRLRGGGWLLQRRTDA